MAASSAKQASVHFRSVWSRGLNIQGQLGIRNRYSPIEDFGRVDILQNKDIEKIVSGDSQNLALVNQRYQLMFWGWPLCTRTTYRFIEQYEYIPRMTRWIQSYTPFFKSGVDNPTLEASFEYPVEHVRLGTGYITIIDQRNHVYSWGDNYAGQLGTRDDIHREEPHLVKSLSEVDIASLSLGFQHQLFVDVEGHVYGLGKNTRYQLGKFWNYDEQHGEVFDRYSHANRIQAPEIDNPYFNGERVKQVAAGKFHTLFLTEAGKVFSVGFNKYGQLGVANSMYMHAEEPIEVFTDGVKIQAIDAGWHHNLLLGEDGNLYGFGARWNGQIDGRSHEGRQEQCSMKQIRLPDDDTNKSPIVSFQASNLRSQIVRENGEIWFWGGYFYRGMDKLFISDFNLLNEEEGLPKDLKIIQHEMGFAHDSVLVEEAPSELVTKVEHEYMPFDENHASVI